MFSWFNKKKVLLIQTPPWGVTTMPLGIGCLEAYLRKSGFSVDILDLNIMLYRSADKENKAVWDTGDFEFWRSGAFQNAHFWDEDRLCSLILKKKYDFLGFSATVASGVVLNRLLTRLRSMKVASKIIIGGAIASSADHRHLINPGLADYFIAGEGEFSFKMIVAGDDLVEKKDNGDISLWNDEFSPDTVCVKSLKPFIPGKSCYPDFRKFPVTEYTEQDLAPIMLSRGCINHCSFCCDWEMKRPFRSRKAEDIFQEMRFHVRKINRTRFEFCDLLINGNLKELERLCELIVKNRLNIAWGGQAAVRSQMSQDLFNLMHEAGCGGLTFGIETLSDSLLEIMNKPFRQNDALQVLGRAKKAGMRVEANLLVGFPGETEQDVDETISFLKTNSHLFDNINSLNVCCLDYGMEIFKDPEKFGINMDDFDDLYAWHTSNMDNTLEIRKQRHARIRTVLDELGFSAGWQNVRD